MKIVLTLLFLVTLAVSAAASNPSCDGVNNWAASMAFGHLKNARIIFNESTDFTKTKVVRLASEKIGRGLYRQVHRVTFTETSGKTIDVITINDASHEECSMSGVEVFVVSRHLGNLKE